MNILHLDSSILGQNSVSRMLSAELLARLKTNAPDATVTYRDLTATPLAHLSGLHLASAPEVASENAAGGAVLKAFMEADVIVIGVAFYNFTISSQLKAWVDRILIAGQTFRYGPDGRPEGLAAGKRVILAIARGGFYGPGMAAAPFEYAERYLRTVFGFIGIDRIEVVSADGLAAGPDPRAAGIAGAKAQIESIMV